jgi:hypothetical protein
MKARGKASENKYLFAIAIRHALLYDFHMPDETQTASASATECYSGCLPALPGLRSWCGFRFGLRGGCDGIAS